MFNQNLLIPTDMFNQNLLIPTDMFNQNLLIPTYTFNQNLRLSTTMKLLTWEVGHEDDLRVVGGVVESFLDLGQLASPVRQADE